MFKAIAGLFAGMALLVMSALMAMSSRDFLRTAIAATGQVVALNAGGSHPQIAFVTQAGERISYPQGGMIHAMKVGDKATVLYRPDAPSIGPTMDRFGAVWGAR